jgi:hypothetical protein
MWVDWKAGFKELIEMVPIPKHTGWKKHSQVSRVLFICIGCAQH